MTAFRWTSPNQPQTLQIAVFLMYFRAVFSLLGARVLFVPGQFRLLLIIGLVAGAIGIANEKRWGYIVGVAVAIIPVFYLVQFLLRGNYEVLIQLLFDGALLALLLHPMSRDYQRIWFR
ncbi:MAG: hypothetical protein AAGA17_06265 [Actinomycetota bacterium]